MTRYKKLEIGTIKCSREGLSVKVKFFSALIVEFAVLFFVRHQLIFVSPIVDFDYLNTV